VLIRQHWINRFGSFVSGGILIACGLSIVSDPTNSPNLFAVLLFVAVPLWLVIRSLRASVECTSEKILVRGWIWSRLIPRSHITSLSSGWRVIHWTSRSGSKRLTPLPMFWDFPNATYSMDQHNAEAIAEVQRWIRGDAPKPSEPGRHVREQ
jgi:hypothetical protein